MSCNLSWQLVGGVKGSAPVINLVFSKCPPGPDFQERSHRRGHRSREFLAPVEYSHIDLVAWNERFRPACLCRPEVNVASLWICPWRPVVGRSSKSSVFASPSSGIRTLLSPNMLNSAGMDIPKMRSEKFATGELQMRFAAGQSCGHGPT